MSMRTALGARTPAVFVGHGSPTNALEDNAATQFWQQLPAQVGPVNAILCISAHWHIDQVAVTAMSQPSTIHDFGRGLPGPLFDIQYPAPGSPALAQRVVELLSPETVSLDQSWGLDHGTWSVLCRAWPNADVPVVQLAMDARQPLAWHYQLAQQLKPLRDEGVLVLGSGNIVHNLGVMQWDDAAQPYDWATRFNQHMKSCIQDNDIDGLLDYASQGQDAALSVPTVEHLLPLYYVMGVRDPSDQARFETDFVVYKSLAMTSLVLS